MSEAFVLNAEVRNDKGKGASRRLRRLADQVPAIIYGGEKEPVSVTLQHKDLIKQLENEAFYSHIITVNVGSENESVILKDLQRHPAKDKVLHADFLRVSATKKLKTTVPLHFINEDTCKGVKLEGGNISHAVTELEISCLAADLPEFIEVDMVDVEVGQIVHISDLKLPQGVESVALSHGADYDLTVATVNKPKGGAEEEESAEEGEEG